MGRSRSARRVRLYDGKHEALKRLNRYLVAYQFDAPILAFAFSSSIRRNRRSRKRQTVLANLELFRTLSLAHWPLTQHGAGVEIQAVKCDAASAIDLGRHLLRRDESCGWMGRTEFHNIH